MWKVFTLGVVFGLALTMGEVISWFRIYEMFSFASFHMYGIIGGAIVVGSIFHMLAKRVGWKALNGNVLDIHQYAFEWKRYVLGGMCFGMGWALTGACPGPLFIALGAGYFPILVAIFGALAGTFLYGMLRKYLPH